MNDYKVLLRETKRAKSFINSGACESKYYFFCPYRYWQGEGEKVKLSGQDALEFNFSSEKDMSNLITTLKSSSPPLETLARIEKDSDSEEQIRFIISQQVNMLLDMSPSLEYLSGHFSKKEISDNFVYLNTLPCGGKVFASKGVFEFAENKRYFYLKLFYFELLDGEFKLKIPAEDIKNIILIER